MTGQQWAEWGVVGFSMAVLSWVIFRLTQTLVRIIHPGKTYDDQDEGA